MTPTEHIIHRLQQGLHELNSRKQQVSAGDTRELLVTPFLKHLGYPLETTAGISPATTAAPT